MPVPSHHNLLTDLAGVRVGHAHDARIATGVTAIVFDTANVASAVTRGGAPGARDTPLLEPEMTVEGVDAVHVYAFPLPAGGPIFLGVATYGIVRADIGTRFGAQFRNSGFTLTSGSELATGRYLIAAIARDTVTGRFNTVRTATVTVSIPVSVPRMAIDSPIAGASVAGAFTIKGWAIDTGATAGPGVDVIHVYAMLVGGSTPIFLGVGTYGTPRPDIAGMFGAQFANSGYQLNAGGLSPGTYTIAVFARSTVSGQFSGAATTVTVASTTAMAIDLPAAGSRAPAPFAVAGWALDAAAPTGSGVDAIHAWALPLGGGAPIFLGVGLLDAPRVRVVDPLGYIEFMSLVRGAAAIVTDSGGVQEETTLLRVPCLTLRPNTERPITITSGSNRLVTTGELAASVLKACHDGPYSGELPPLWDGKAGLRIARIITNWLRGAEGAGPAGPAGTAGAADPADGASR